jgi:hypothetical protein
VAIVPTLVHLGWSSPQWRLQNSACSWLDVPCALSSLVAHYSRLATLPCLLCCRHSRRSHLCSGGLRSTQLQHQQPERHCIWLSPSS